MSWSKTGPGRAGMQKLFTVYVVRLLNVRPIFSKKMIMPCLVIRV